MSDIKFEAFDMLTQILYDVAEIAFYKDGTIDGLLRNKETGEIVGGRTYFNKHVLVDGVDEQYIILLPVQKHEFKAWDVGGQCWIPPELIAITGDGEIFTRDDKRGRWKKEVIPIIIVKDESLLNPN